MAAPPVSTIPVERGHIGYRRMGDGRPLVVLNGLAATKADWDPGFLERLASANKLVLLDNRGIGASQDAWHRDGAGAGLGELRRRALVLTGTEDIVIPPANALTLVQAIPGAWLAQFPDAGHAFMAQYPRAAANVVNEFLAL